MATGTDYTNLYREAYAAYGQGNLEEAVNLIERMAREFPGDPNVLLLQGHIYLSQQQYELARQRYESVLQLEERSDLHDFAQQGLEQLQKLQSLTAGGGKPILEEEEAVGSEAPTSYYPAPDWQETPATGGEDEPLTYLAGEESYPEVSAADWESGVLSSGELEETPLPEGEIDPFSSPFAGEGITSEELEEELSFGEEEDWEQEIGEATFAIASVTEENSAPSSLSAGFSSQAKTVTGEKAPEDSEQRPEQGEQGREQLEGPTSEGGDSFLDKLDFGEGDWEGIAQLDLAEVMSELADGESLNGAVGNLTGDSKTDQFSHQEAAQPSDINWPESPEGGKENLGGISPLLVKPTVEVEQGPLAWFKNASLWQKQWLVAAAAGLAPILAILIFSGATWLFSPHDKSPKAPPAQGKPGQVTGGNNQPGQAFSPFSRTGLWLLLVAGASGFGTSFLLGQVATRQMKQSLNDLQTQFEAIREGNFNVKATVYSQDEVGRLSASFNQIARFVSLTTHRASARAAEVEQAKEDLQRQVIRLLDDVEGAARGDLTVEAKVSADLLGAVADSFNLTIQNLREIVRQVKAVAEQVNKRATDSESFAHKNSSDALRMAEELAVTLQSVQVMNESIQRVAENAREAEEVARTSSVTALKGGEAVERTVSGILQIQETVSETARKVKRLAEASQEISKIVAIISQISSRTNLLALNASIQAARAGEAGRGFAIVADEVRQLADRSKKSLQEIEQIVLQIQSETGSVMEAMEEGIQQVLDVSEKSEQAKGALEDIIEVSNHIDQLVRSITADTIQQKENSQAAAQVMQSVETVAQEASQESQRVAGSLQKLVAISRDLLASVERFRIE